MGNNKNKCIEACKNGNLKKVQKYNKYYITSEGFIYAYYNG